MLGAPTTRSAGKPVAIVDIGSNSVRLVAYEGLTRTLTPIFNEKILCGLGRSVASTGLLAEEAVEKTLTALRNFRALCDNMRIEDVQVFATAATRDATNGTAFLARAVDAIGAKVTLIDGRREAELSALGVISTFSDVDGVIGDLGGGSLELASVQGTGIVPGISLPIGGLALMELSGGVPKRALKLVRDALHDVPSLKDLRDRSFYAVGGTWRALARLHMRQCSYPLDVMHGYLIPAGEAGAFGRLIERVSADAPLSVGAVNSARRPLLPFGAVILDEIIRLGRPKNVIISAAGVRDGFMFERLPEAERALDPLIAAARELNLLRSRDPRHGDDLCAWTDTLMASARLDETATEVRLRHAACMMSDGLWRAHPDDRSAQALHALANINVGGIDHPGRCFLAFAVAYRHSGVDEDIGPQLRSLLSPRLLERARILGTAMRVAFILSAAMGNVLPRMRLTGERSAKLRLTLGAADRSLASEKAANRLKQLAKLMGREPEIRIDR